jgi:hypothetical protein
MTRIPSKVEKTCLGCLQVKPIEEFVTIYGFKNPRGKYCHDCFLTHEHNHAVSLLEGRNFCLYCGKKIEKAYDWTPEGNSAKNYLNRDHMDPVALGGEDSQHNTVFCCVSCNLKKVNRPFTEWLQMLSPEYRELSRKIYAEKHAHQPEDFTPSVNRLIITVDLGDPTTEL